MIKPSNGLLMFASHIVLVSGALFLAGCGGTSYWDTSLDPTKLQGKSHVWFEKNWGKPSSKVQRFFGGETWIYFRIAGEERPFSFFDDGPNECQISLDFGKEGNLEASGYFGC